MQYYILILDAIRLVLFLVDKRWRGAVIYVAVFGGSLRLERGAWLLVLTQKSVQICRGVPSGNSEKQLWNFEGIRYWRMAEGYKGNCLPSVSSV